VLVLQVWLPLQPSFVQSGTHCPDGQKLPVGQSASVRQVAKGLAWQLPETQASPIEQSLSSTQFPDVPWQAENPRAPTSVRNVSWYDIRVCSLVAKKKPPPTPV
jgi:hypothetical protein